MKFTEALSKNYKGNKIDESDKVAHFFANIKDDWFEEHLQPPGVLNVCDLKSKDIFRSNSFRLPDKRRYCHLGNLKYLKVNSFSRLHQISCPAYHLICI